MLGSHLEAFTELRFAPGTQVADIDHAVGDLPELVESFTLAGHAVSIGVSIGIAMYPDHGADVKTLDRPVRG